MERLNSTVHLVLYVKRHGVFMNPHDVVDFLVAEDLDMLSIFLNDVVEAAYGKL